MRKILLVAKRDFLATVSTKGFIIAIMVPPLIWAAIILAFPRMMNNRVPAVTGTRRGDRSDRAGGAGHPPLSRSAGDGRAPRCDVQRARSNPAPMAGAGGRGGAQRAVLGELPDLEIVESPRMPRSPSRRSGSRATPDRASLPCSSSIPTPRSPNDDGIFGAYDLFVRRNLDNRIQNEIRNAAAEAIVDARVRAAGLDRQRIDALTKVARPPSVTVTATGESATRADFAGLLPMGFTILLMISVMSSGQYLLTTTIEEKSSRTMEVILSAVSPLELLTGKILGQMAVGLTILVTYSSMGILGLVSMAMFGLLDPSLLIYLFIFFLITYVIMGSLMAAIGSAVNELREAQSLMTPITLLMMVPWLFWYPISRDPNSLFATVVSFIPPMNAFAMLLRLTSTSPPPMWQVWLSIAVGIAAAGGALWFASRVFKIGLLMHGRPPNFATLLRWARQA